MKAKLSITTLVFGFISAGACAPDSIAPRGNDTLAPPSDALAAKTSATSGAAVAIDDALSRLLPSLDPEVSESLQGPLIAVQATLKSRDLAALAGAISVARQALGQNPTFADDPDLVAISLALDAASGQ